MNGNVTNIDLDWRSLMGVRAIGRDCGAVNAQPQSVWKICECVLYGMRGAYTTSNAVFADVMVCKMEHFQVFFVVVRAINELPVTGSAGPLPGAASALSGHSRV